MHPKEFHLAGDADKLAQMAKKMGELASVAKAKRRPQMQAEAQAIANALYDAAKSMRRLAEKINLDLA